jgi:hypothetical protein
MVVAGLATKRVSGSASNGPASAIPQFSSSVVFNRRRVTGFSPALNRAALESGKLRSVRDRQRARYSLGEPVSFR